MLTKLVSVDEIRNTAISIEQIKASGNNGMTKKIFQIHWETLKLDVSEAIRCFIRHGLLLRYFNHTIISLVLKVQTVKTMRDLCPIRLCSVFYKIIFKILSLSAFISDWYVSLGEYCQSAFIQGRLILDNILVTQEIMYFLKNKRDSHIHDIKLDMSKAFDRVE